jgi:hypothetical protein
MFERRRERKAAARYQDALARWQRERDEQTAAVTLAQTYAGEPTTELVLHAGEAVFAKVTNVGLVEPRKGPGQWRGRSSGVSIPIGSLGGRTVRYRIGASRGHYVQGAPHPTAIDTGTLFITNQRLVFEGHSQTRECPFTKLLGYEHGDDGTTTVSVSNRQRPVTVHYGANLNGWVRLRLDLALAHFHGDVPALVERLQQGLAAVDAEKPSPPPGPPAS